MIFCGIKARPLQNGATVYALNSEHERSQALRTFFFKEVFIMQKSTALRWKELLLSPTLVGKNKSHKIAYISVMTAFIVVANMFFEFKLADVQFSLTILFSALSGLILGAAPGFLACFLGDLFGFLLHPFGAYSPWVGISTGLIAVIAYLVVTFLPLRFRGGLQVRLCIVALLTFAVCTVAINTTAFWIIYNTRKVPFFAYLVTRLFVQGQIFNSVLNYALLFICYPVMLRIKNSITTIK
jgi:uncharacterized membrane protein